MASPIVPPQSLVCIRGVASRPELNGRIGTAIDQKAPEGRCAVQIVRDGDDDDDDSPPPRDAADATKPLSLRRGCLDVIMMPPVGGVGPVARGLRALADGRIQDAFEAATEASMADPVDWRPMTLRAVAAVSFREKFVVNFQLAAQLFDAALRSNGTHRPDDRQKDFLKEQINLCNEELGLDNADVGAAECAADNSSTATLLMKAERSLREGNTQGAFEAAKAARKANPSDWRAWMLQGQALLSMEPAYEINVGAAYCSFERARSCNIPSQVDRAELDELMRKAGGAVSQDVIQSARDFLMVM